MPFSYNYRNLKPVLATYKTLLMRKPIDKTQRNSPSRTNNCQSLAREKNSKINALILIP
jgi:hypothetical protein